MLIACVSSRPDVALHTLASALQYDPLLLQRVVTFVDQAPADPPPLVVLDMEGSPLTLPRSYGSGAVTIAGIADAPAAIGTLGGLTPSAAAPGLHGRLGARHPDGGAVLELLAPDLPLPPSAVWTTAAQAVRRLRPSASSTWRGDPRVRASLPPPDLDAFRHLEAPACAVCGPLDGAELLRACYESRLRGESARPITTLLDRTPERVALYIGDGAVDQAAIELLLTAWRAGSAVELRRLGAAALPDALSFFLDPERSPLEPWLPARAALVPAALLLYPESL